MSYVYVKLETSLGDIVLELNSDAAPITVGNFMEYLVEKHYEGTLFHRVIAGFMIQGGGLAEDMTEKCCPHEPIHNEANNGLKNKKYTVAMARTGEPHSATAQFFINTHDNDFLDFTAETPPRLGLRRFRPGRGRFRHGG